MEVLAFDMLVMVAVAAVVVVVAAQLVVAGWRRHSMRSTERPLRRLKLELVVVADFRRCYYCRIAPVALVVVELVAAAAAAAVHWRQRCVPS